MIVPLPEDPFDDGAPQSEAHLARGFEELAPLLDLARDHVDAPFDSGAAWESLAPRLRRRTRRFQPGPRLPIGVAAVAAVLAAVWVGVRQPAPMDRLVVRSSPAGVLDSLTLSDGTVVVLDGASELQVAEDFGRSRREVFLTGRALFRVAHDPSRIFHVHALGTVSEALGTAFSVAADSVASTVEVVVTEGRVGFAVERDSLGLVLLHPGDRVIRRHGGREILRQSLGAHDLAWTHGRRALDRTLLRDAIPQFRRWYGLDLVVSDSALLTQRITADWDGVAAPTAIAELAQILDATAARRGGDILLTPAHDGGDRAR